MPYPLETYLQLDEETLGQRFSTVQLLLKSRLYWLEHYQECKNDPEFLQQCLKKAQEEVTDLKQEMLNISQAIAIFKYQDSDECDDENQEDDGDDD